MLPAGVPIWVALGPVDLRWSFDLLIGVVRDRLGREPREGLVVFLNRRTDRAKILFHDGSGWCQLYKRLDRGLFPLPETLEVGAVSVTVSHRELALMLLGRETSRTRRPRKVTRSAPIVH
jgi:transposase